jgi:N-acetylmuramoyl-L-alanine amidase
LFRDSLAILVRPLPYVERLNRRQLESIDLVVIHCTELPDLGMAREFGEKVMHKNSHTGNSGHFYIDRDGSIEEWVPVNRVAHHVRGFNSKSIGIELVNNGRYPDWFHSTQQQMTEHYPQAQIEALILLLNDLGQALPGLKLIAGHEVLDNEMIAADDNPDIMINRKLDPGVHFPWQDVLSRVPLNRYQEKF